MRYHFILLKTIFAPQRAVFYFFMTFLSDAGGHLDQGINLEWPYGRRLMTADIQPHFSDIIFNWVVLCNGLTKQTATVRTAAVCMASLLFLYKLLRSGSGQAAV